MFSGESVSPDALNISQSCQSGLQRCMSFIEYPDKYGMSGASTAVYHALQDIPPRTYKYSSGAAIGLVHIETIFNHTPPHSLLSLLIAETALSTAGITGSTFRRQERECEGFALELLRQIRLLLKESQDFRSTDPFNRKGRSYYAIGGRGPWICSVDSTYSETQALEWASMNLTKTHRG